ncbi:hypothetical protein FRC08_009767 [Ceratobasidium sp. 394]|nr:hypothetical protein FRC08_009767 [Ceratobasidium sp. 394]
MQSLGTEKPNDLECCADGACNVLEVEKNGPNVQEEFGENSKFVQKLKTWGVESRGIYPVLVEDRTDPQFSKSFFVWLSSNLNILSFSLGTLGPLSSGLSFRESAGVIVGFSLMAGIPPAYLSTFGPKLGLRQMVQARYSFGWYATAIPGVLQLLGIVGYNIINVILGGQIISVVSGGKLSWNVGIVVITVVSLVITFFGYRVLNWYERYAWFPILIAFLVIIGVGGRHLSDPVATASPTSHQSILSFASTIAGFVISYSPAMSDYTHYMRPEVPSWKLFALSYLGLVLPATSVALVGAAFAASLPNMPEWQAGYDSNGAGGLISAVLIPVGRFGDFLLILLALSVIGSLVCAGHATSAVTTHRGQQGPNLYSFCFSFQVVVPALVRVPRYVFSFFGTVILIPLAIVGATRFQTTLVNFLGLVGYWTSTFVAVVIVEHIVFRRGDFSLYDISTWNSPTRLPPGLAAIGACVLGCGMIAVCMSQVWYTGPVAKLSGDIGLEVGIVLTALCYLPFRSLEKRLYGR